MQPLPTSTKPQSPSHIALLPNVFPELPQGTFGGSTLIIKNTFIDVSRSSAECAGNLQRAKSLPSLFTENSLESQPTTFLDVRRRLLTFHCGDPSECEDTHEKSPRSCTASTCTPASCAPPSPTTVLLKNIPEQYTREMLLETLNAQGFSSRFDFIYAPIDFGTRTSFGYAFINLVTADDADSFMETFQDFTSWSEPTSKVADVDWSDRQGLDTMIDRYRNSPLMHARVPDEAKPIILQDGQRVEFPAPTQPLKPLRVRQSKARKARTLGYDEIQE